MEGGEEMNETTVNPYSEPQAQLWFRVRVDKATSSYTLIQEDITLTAEQAHQIAAAYNAHNGILKHTPRNDNKL